MMPQIPLGWFKKWRLNDDLAKWGHVRKEAAREGQWVIIYTSVVKELKVWSAIVAGGRVLEEQCE